MKSKTKFLIMPPATEVLRKVAHRLQQRFRDVSVVLAADEAHALVEIGGADAVYGKVPRQALANAGQLKWIQSPQANAPMGYYYDELVDHPAIVTNMAGVYSEEVATHILAFVLAFARSLHVYIPQQLSRRWARLPNETGSIDLRRANVLIMAMGSIGRRTAELLEGFGATVSGMDVDIDQPWKFSGDLHTPSAAMSRLHEFDFVISTVPETAESVGMINRTFLASMKPAAFFINVGRGATVVLYDLRDALERQQIAGAALDVFSTEPLPESHPLWASPNIILTPHVAGFGAGVDESRFELLEANLEAFINGHSLRNVINKSLGY